MQYRVEDRWNQHKNDLKNHKHCDYKLTMLYAHYGLEDLIFILEQTIEFNDYQELLDIEGIEIRHIPEDWCLNIGRHPEIGAMYNRSGENSPNWNRHPSEETKLLWSEQRKGENNPNWNKHPSEETRDKLIVSHLKENLTLETLNKMSIAKVGENNPLWNKANSKKGCNYLDTTPNREYYFITNMTRYCNTFYLNPGNMIKALKGMQKSSKGHTPKYPEQWMIDKVLPLMNPGQYWVEVDLEGNIINNVTLEG